jgi:hypothetical protein
VSERLKLLLLLALLCGCEQPPEAAIVLLQQLHLGSTPQAHT